MNDRQQTSDSLLADNLETPPSSPSRLHPPHTNLSVRDAQSSDALETLIAVESTLKQPTQQSALWKADGVIEVPETRAKKISSLPYEFDEDSVKVLVAARKKKVKGVPMQTILANLSNYDGFEVAILDEELMTTRPAEEWPKADCLMTFKSGNNYPTEEIKKYIDIHEPFYFNDIDMMDTLESRFEMYRIMDANDIPAPNHILADLSNPETEVSQKEDSITINGKTLTKPYVMKPMDAENHNIYIFFHSQDGGGAQHLFRKRKDQSSEFIPNYNEVPSEGSYIFEEFLPTGGTDIKVYTVGPHYAHAEGRKAPVLDGKVMRDENGKELRCPILLGRFEKDIARKVVEAFGQNVCGFDLLRTQDNKSYVCDVNGWSFVKRSPHYFSDCARIMHSMILQYARPSSFRPSNDFLVSETESEDEDYPEPEEVPRIKCVIGIVHHSLRSPKQKVKFKTRLREFVELASATHSLKFKSPAELSRVQSACVQVLETKPDCTEATAIQDIVEVLSSSPIAGINRKFQLKPTNLDGDGNLDEVQVIMKWGGQLTGEGLLAAQQAGESFRTCLYSLDSSNSDQDDLLRLHSNYQHDLKLYSSEEGRVQMTAAAFTKGLLKLDGELTPVLVTLVRKDKAAHTMLTDTSEASTVLDEAKKELEKAMHEEQDTAILDRASLDSEQKTAWQGNSPLKILHTIDQSMSNVVDELGSYLPSVSDEDAAEELKTIMRKFSKLRKDVYNGKTNRFNISKLSEVTDWVQFYKPAISPIVDTAVVEQLTSACHVAMHLVGNLEYGMNEVVQISIARLILRRLCKKILHDIKVAMGMKDYNSDFAHEITHRADRKRGGGKGRIRTRLYFTGMSHMTTLLLLLRIRGADVIDPDALPARGHSLTQLVFRLVEYPSRRKKVVEILICRGFESVQAAKPCRDMYVKVASIHLSVLERILQC